MSVIAYGVVISIWLFIYFILLYFLYSFIPSESRSFKKITIFHYFECNLQPNYVLSVLRPLKRIVRWKHIALVIERKP